MSETQAPNPESTLALPADLGIEHAAELHAALAPLLAAVAPVALVGAAVERVHTAGLQVLALFGQDRAAHGGSTQIEAPSATLLAGLQTLGLAPLFGLHGSDD